jgi:membrane associated rhomboid family serine protease
MRHRARPGRALLAMELLPLAPALALGFANALVVQWLGGELGRLLPRAWSSGLLLAVTLIVLQLLALRPLARLRRLAPLTLESSADPHRVWRWITAPWVHHRPAEAWLNALMLLILLGGSPLSLDQLLLRYLLTSLATMAPAVLLARRWLSAAIWDGATGAVAALIALATGVSLLHWRPVSFPFGVLTVPCWVLLLVYGAIQMGWVLPRQTGEETAPPWQRLLSSCWGWGTILGLIWALATRLLEWGEPLWRAVGRA